MAYSYAVLLENKLQQWKLTGFYGHPDIAKWHETWSLFKSLLMDYKEPWMVLKHFNEGLNQAGKKGENYRPEKQHMEFQEAQVTVS